MRTIFEGGGGGITVEATHSDTEQGSYCEELAVGLRESGAELQDDEEDVIDDKGPFATIAIRSNTKNCRADRPKHENQGDTPCDLSVRLVELLG